MRNEDFWWSDRAVQTVKERYRIDGPTKLAEELGTTPVSVKMKARKLGLLQKRLIKPYEWTEEMLETLERVYPELDKEGLAAAFPGLPLYVIRSKARRLGIRNDRRIEFSAKTRREKSKSCDGHFLDEWNPDMAYVLGFIFADGSITKRLGDIVIGISTKDIQVVEYIQKVTKSTRKLRFVEEWYDTEGYKHNAAVYLNLSSTLLVQRAMELGVKHRKTYNDDPFPEVPDDMLPHFVRGYFDGDGYFFIGGQGWPRLGVVGSIKFITGIRSRLISLLGMKECKLHLNKTKTCTWARTNWSAEGDIRKFRDFIYPEGFPFCLQRKKSLMDNWLNSRTSFKGV